MKKYILFISLGMCLLLISIAVCGQTLSQSDRYINYPAYLGNALKNKFQPGKEDTAYKSLKLIQIAAGKLTDEHAPMTNLQTKKGNKKILTDEEIFAKRQKSVFVMGKLFTSGSKATASLNFDLIGTAFAISENGVCVTNYHVLKDIIQPDTQSKTRDSLYFIITPDRKIYLLNEILAFSQNNDLAVFKVNLIGNKVCPIPLGAPSNIGETVYCISHPQGHFYYFSKGIVSRNVSIDTLELEGQYDRNGRRPIRMEITADYGIGSSGGPILNKSGNLIGVVVSTAAINGGVTNGKGKDIYYKQMIIKDTTPIAALRDLLIK